LEAATIQNTIGAPPTIAPQAETPSAAGPRAQAYAFQAATWLGGLEAFFDNEALSTNSVTDFTRPLLISRSALQRAAAACFSLIEELGGGNTNGIDTADVLALHAAIRKPLMLCEPILEAGPLGEPGWEAWRSYAVESLHACSSYDKFIAAADADGINFLPRNLRAVLAEKASGEEAEDLSEVLPRFGTILRILDLVGEMLERDEPLKASLVLFSKAAEKIRALISDLNARVERGGEEPEGLLGVFDGASYMTSIELKKVMQQELSGIVTLRPVTTIYARNETAYALLTEGFQQILAQFARHVDPEVDMFDLFPSFKHKRDQSIVLRSELHALGVLTRAAEANPDPVRFEKLKLELERFASSTIRYFFYKDIETFERFVEEILANKDQTDLTALLHRFGAYVETLFGQVSLRAVLENHPFESEA
jgi:hypothetical protein